MKLNRFSEEQIIGILKQAESGVRAYLCRQYGFFDVTFYKWRTKFGGMSVSDAKRLRQLEEENSRLKKNCCQSDAGDICTQGYAVKKLIRPARRKAVQYVQDTYGFCLCSCRCEPQCYKACS